MSKTSRSGGTDEGQARFRVSLQLRARFSAASAFTTLGTVILGPVFTNRTSEVGYTPVVPVSIAGCFFIGFALPEIAMLAAAVATKSRRWASPLLALMGALTLAIPATLFPPRARRAWLGEVLESLALRQEHRTNWFMVLASYVRTWPADLLDEWLDYLKRRPNDLDLTANVGQVPSAQVSGGYWKRHRTEIVWGIVWALVFAPVAAVAYEAVTETMHHTGYRWLWEAGEGH